MNEILQNRIEKAVKKTIQEYNESFRYENGMELEPLIKIFLEKIGTIFFEHGISFALQNQWISVDEALPEFEGNFSDYYIIKTENGGYAVTMYYRTSEKEYWWNFEKVKVTHWMEIPKLNSNE